MGAVLKIFLLSILVSYGFTIALTKGRRQLHENTNYSIGDLPATKRSMQDLDVILGLLRKGIPFGYAHFNDGEITAIAPESCFVESDGQRTTDWGWQNCSIALGKAMLSALTNTADNFYIGIPCVCEWNGDRTTKALRYLNISHAPLPEKCPAQNIELTVSKNANPLLASRLTVATIFINGNYRRARKDMIFLLNMINLSPGRTVYTVLGKDLDSRRLPFRSKAIHAARRHAFEHDYSRMRTAQFVHDHFQKNDVVLIMLGSLGRILASEWTLITNQTTFIEMGSFWDHDLWGRKYSLDNDQPCNFVEDLRMA